jgi:hypothetical protein
LQSSAQDDLTFFNETKFFFFSAQGSALLVRPILDPTDRTNPYDNFIPVYFPGNTTWYEYKYTDVDVYANINPFLGHKSGKENFRFRKRVNILCQYFILKISSLILMAK